MEVNGHKEKFPIDYSMLPKMASIPPKDKKNVPGFFERLVGYNRVEYLKKLMGVKDRLYEDTKMDVKVKGTAAKPTYIPGQGAFRIVGCTGKGRNEGNFIYQQNNSRNTQRQPYFGMVSSLHAKNASVSRMWSCMYWLRL